MSAPKTPAAAELERRHAANKRVGWSLAALALAIFLFSMFLRS
ncbi:hypothetical protein [Uliginosibacterium flavum]